MASPKSGVRIRAARVGLFGLLANLLILVTGCAEKSDSTSSPSAEGNTKIRLQLDWLPEAAHGGFYQAQLDGAYANRGLEVEILTGGSGVKPLQNIVLGRAEIGTGSLDEVILAIESGLPLVVIGAYYQHSPQAVLLHADDPAQDLADLDGRSFMTTPGGPIALWLEKAFSITLNIVPIDYSTQRFIADKKLTQQCFATSQPFHVENQGVDTRTLLFSEYGFDAARVLYCSGPFLKSNSDAVSAFLEASLVGWDGYVYGDRSRVDEQLLALNQINTAGLNDYTVNTMRDLRIFEGRRDGPFAPGALPAARVEEMLRTLADIGLIKDADRFSAEDIVPYSQLPRFVEFPGEGLPDMPYALQFGKSP